MSKHAPRRSGRAGTVIGGLILVALGGWSLLRAAGIPLPGMDMLWPIFPTLVGAAFFVGWLFTPDKRSSFGMAIPGTICLLVGLFFFGFTMGFFEWSDMAYLWPVFPLIVGISFVVAWAFSFFREWGLLIPGGITGTVGLVGLAFTLGETGNVYLNWIVKGWPVILILVGLIVLVGSLLGGGERRRRPDEEERVTEEYKYEGD